AARDARRRADVGEFAREPPRLVLLQSRDRDAHRRWSLAETVRRARREHPAALRERADDAGLVRDRYPHVQAGRARRDDVALAQGLDQRLASLRIDRTRALDRSAYVRILQQSEHEPLEDVADPAGAALLAPLHTRERLLVAAQHRQAQVGAER